MTLAPFFTKLRPALRARRILALLACAGSVAAPLAAASLAAAPLVTGCASAGQGYLGLISGPVNDPSNRTLRRSILAWGLETFCAEMTQRSAPLTLSPDAPVAGRFYPTQCTQRTAPDGDLYIEFSGRGYAFTNVTRKMVFLAGGTVRYDQDFLMDGSTMYAYFRTKTVDQSSFSALLIELPAAQVMNAVLPIGNTVGRELVGAKLRDGFTVLRDSDGRADFSLGLVPKGSRPKRAFDDDGDDGKRVVESLVSEVHSGQRDFIGPVKVDGKGRALTLRLRVDGAPAADVYILGEGAGRASLESYLSATTARPLAGPPVAYDTVRLGQDYVRTVSVPPGLYYVVLDNTLRGAAPPPMMPLDDRAATFRYTLSVGDEP